VGLLDPVGPHDGGGVRGWCFSTAHVRWAGLSWGLYLAPAIKSRRGLSAGHARVMPLWWVVPFSQITTTTGRQSKLRQRGDLLAVSGELQGSGTKLVIVFGG
jgi:hypothetical protein